MALRFRINRLQMYEDISNTSRRASSARTPRFLIRPSRTTTPPPRFPPPLTYCTDAFVLMVFRIAELFHCGSMPPKTKQSAFDKLTNGSRIQAYPAQHPTRKQKKASGGAAQPMKEPRSSYSVQTLPPKWIYLGPLIWAGNLLASCTLRVRKRLIY